MEDINHKVQLTTGEITNLWTQYMSDTMAICFLSHSIEKVQDKDVRDILLFALSLAESHVEKIKHFFNEENFPIPKGFTKEDVNLSAPALFTDTFLLSEITDSTVPPFSDKLMLYHIVILVSTGVGYLGAALSVSQRRDLALKYTLLMADMGRYAEDGAQLLIDNGWLEQPPLAEDRDHLANK